MLDPKLLRTDLDHVIAALGRRRFAFSRDAYEVAEERRKDLQVQVEELQGMGRRNARAVGEAKGRGDDTKEKELLRLGEDLKRRLESLETELGEARAILETLLSGVPNLPADEAPDGKDENDNPELRRWGQTPDFSFEAKDHVAIAEGMGLMDNAAAAKVAGSRFTVLFGDLAKLQRALIRFMLDVQINEYGYREVYAPYIVKAHCLHGTGQLPKFGEDLFALSGDADRYLVPTAEVPLTNLYRDTIIEEEALPIKLVAHTPCFRSEAGSYGKDTRGMIRQHQFEKVELVQIVAGDASPAALEALTGHAEAVLQKLELPYRVVELCTGDLGFSAARTYDLEVWFPAQGRYREISSCSNMTDFQARRVKVRVRGRNGKLELAHTLNGSGLAAGRTLAAVLENCQDEQGSVRVPRALVPYMDGTSVITSVPSPGKE